MSDKITYNNLSVPLKIGFIGGIIYLSFLVLSFIIGFGVGLIGEI